jgi:mannosyltransferase
MPPESPVNGSASPAQPQSEKVPLVHWLTLVLLCASGTALRFQCLACKPFWSDECFSVEIAWIDWRNFLHLMWWREANMSLYYVLLRIWLHFGHSQFFIRSLSVLISAATLPAIYWLAQLLYDRRVALIATALLAFNAYHVRYAQEARSYALFVLLAILSSGFLVAWLKRPERRYRLGHIVASILAVYAHFYALLLLAAQWLVVRWFGYPDRIVGESRVIASAALRRTWAVIGIAVLPLLIFVAKTGAGPIKWIHRPGVRDLLEFFNNLSGGSWLVAVIFAIACVGALAPVGKRLLVRDQSWETWRCQFLILWLLFPVALTVALSFARPVFLPRYLIFCLSALLILVAAGLARMRQSWLLATTLAALLLLSLPGIFFVYGHDFDTDRDAAGAATNFILDHTQTGDAVVFYIPATRLPYEFFRSQRAGKNSASPAFTTPLGPEILFPSHGPGLDYRDFTGKPSANLLHAIPPNHPRVWVMLMNNQPAWSLDPTTAMITQTFSDSFPKVQRWQFPKVELRLYSRE